MVDDYDDATRLRAYAIWEQQGRPDGQHESHWKQALAELGLLDPVEVMGAEPIKTRKQRDISAGPSIDNASRPR
jgi:hypothetical protein